MNDPDFSLMNLRSGKNSLVRNSEVILNTRVRLARNINGSKFVTLASPLEKDDVLKRLKNLTSKSKEFQDFRFYNLKYMTRIQRELLFEDYLINPEMGKRLKGKGVLVKTNPAYMGKSISILINHEDHLMMQCVYPGVNIPDSYKEIISVEKQFEKSLSFAFDNDLGYLTNNPANLGTGLKIAVTAHLPALSINPSIADFIKNLTRVGCSISSYFGGNMDVVGNLFSVFSLKALGKSEEEIVEEMQAICLNIIDEEKNTRNNLLASDLIGVKDNVYRSYGLLKYAKILSYEESLELLSILRLGLDLKIIGEIKDFDFFELINIISDSHLILNYEINDEITDDQLDGLRADLLRNRVLKEKI